MYDVDDSSSWERYIEKQMTAAAEQAEEYPDVVAAIFMGNENVRCSDSSDYDDMNFSPADIIDYVDQMRAKLEEKGIE